MHQNLNFPDIKLGKGTVGVIKKISNMKKSKKMHSTKFFIIFSLFSPFFGYSQQKAELTIDETITYIVDNQNVFANCNDLEDGAVLDGCSSQLNITKNGLLRLTLTKRIHLKNVRNSDIRSEFYNEVNLKNTKYITLDSYEGSHDLSIECIEGPCFSTSYNGRKLNHYRSGSLAVIDKDSGMRIMRALNHLRELLIKSDPFGH